MKLQQCHLVAVSETGWAWTRKTKESSYPLKCFFTNTITILDIIHRPVFYLKLDSTL
jgi:hypothetical protein